MDMDQLAVPNLPRKCDFRLAAPAGLLPEFADVQCKLTSQGADGVLDSCLSAGWET